MAFTGIDPYQVPQDWVAISNLLIERGTEFHINSEADDWHISLSELRPSSAQAMPTIYGRCGEIEMSCAVNRETLNQFLAMIIDDIDLGLIPEALVEAALEKLIKPVQGYVNKNFGHWLEIEKFDKAASLPENTPVLACCLLVGDKNFNFDLRISFDLLTTFLLEQELQPAALETLPSLRVAMILGYTSLQYAELRDCGCGDVLFFEHCFHNEGKVVALTIAGQPSWLAQVSGQHLELLNKRMPKMDEHSDIEPLEDVEVNVNRLPLAVSFELGEIELPIDTVANFQPGYVVDLSLEATPPIAVKVNGRRIATGELVSVAGHLGVRLVTTG